MTLTLALRTALSGLAATQTALQVSSNNITNVNTEGYSRKDVTFSTRTINTTGAGVNVATVDRVVDEFLIKEIRDQQATIGNLEVREEILSQLEALFSSPENDRSITNALSTVRDTLEAFATTPESSASAFNVVNELRKAALQIQDLADSVQNLRLRADQEISRGATDIQTQLNSIHDLNTRVARAANLNTPSGEERDERDRAVNKLAEQMDLRIIEDSNSLLTILTNTGRNLISGAVVETVSHVSAVQMSASLSYLEPTDSGYPGGVTGIFLGTPDTSNGTNDITTEITTGRLKGLIDLRDTVLPNIQAELDTLVQKLTVQLNAAHNDATAAPPPNSLTGSQTFASGDPLSATGAASIIVINRSTGDVVETLNISNLGATSVDTVGEIVSTINAMTNASASLDSNGKLQISANSTANGIAIANSNSTYTVIQGETRDFSHFFGMNDLIVQEDNSSDYNSFASSQQTNSTTALGLAGNLTFTGNFTNSPVTIAYSTGQSLDTIASNITANSDLTNANISAKVVNDGSGRRLIISDSDGNNFRIADSGSLATQVQLTSDNRALSGRFQVNSEIISDPTRLGHGTVSTSTGISPGDATAATTIAGVFAQTITFGTSGGISGVATTLGEYASQMLGLQVSQTNDARVELEFTKQFTDTLQFRAASVSGVNLDEELANLVVLEQSFNASARIITTASDMLQELIDAVR
ncbi:MAG: flagellar hook-associated protein FlgK [Pseudomonadota bacterium]|nr:flagellar hook-associated protein FlgK [Pseudomonadota bacterium]